MVSSFYTIYQTKGAGVLDDLAEAVQFSETEAEWSATRTVLVNNDTTA